MGVCCVAKEAKVVPDQTSDRVKLTSSILVNSNIHQLVRRRSFRGGSKDQKQQDPVVGSRFLSIKSQWKPRGNLVQDSPSLSESMSLLSTLRSHFILKHLEEESQRRLISSMNLYEVGPRAVIIEQGEPGSFFYIISKGRVEVCINGIRGSVLNPFQSFGELALLDDSLSSVSVSSIDRSALWVLDRLSFKHAVQAINDSNYEENKLFLDNVPVFAGLSDSQKYNMLNFMNVQKWETGQNIVNEGEIGTLLYIIKEGRVSCKQGGKNLRELQKGDVFGERAILNSEYRTATVTALETVKLLSVSKENLFTCFGDHIEKVLYRNALRIEIENDRNLSLLSKEHLDFIIESMKIVTYERNEIVIPESEIKGESLYLVIKGRVNVNEKCIGNTSIFVSNNEIFGDNITATEHSVVGVIKRIQIEECVGGKLSDLSNYNQIYKILESLPIFRGLSFGKLSQIAKIAEKRVFSPSEEIFNDDSPASSLFVIESGTVELWQSGNFLRSFSDLSYFGEAALFNSGRRQISAYAQTDLVCWELTLLLLSSMLPQKALDTIKLRIDLSDHTISIEDLIPIRFLGKGASGNVYMCYYPERETFYAIKAVHRQTVMDYELHSMIIMEKNILLQIDHFLVMKLVKTFKDKNRLYFLTEFVDGQDLFEVIRHLGVTKQSEAKFYTACLLLMLEHLQGRGIAHRDLKPENIMIDQDGFPKLLDMGTAKIIKDRTYTAIGTPHYMAPEVIIGAGYGIEVDWWGLGIMLYEFLFGDVPFGGNFDDIPSIYQAILAHSIEYPTLHKMHKAKSLIETLLEQKPHLRASGNIKKMKVHPWLRQFDWEAVYSRNAKTPFIPKTKKNKAKIAKAISKRKRLVEFIENKEKGSMTYQDDWDLDF